MQHIHVNNGNTFLFMDDVPNTAKETYILTSADGYKIQAVFYTDKYDTSPPWFILPAGIWQIISKADAITEEQAKEIVQLHHIAPLSYEHYEFRVIALYSAKESLNTLLCSYSLQSETTLILKKE